MELIIANSFENERGGYMKKKILFALFISVLSLSGCNTSNSTNSPSIIETDAKVETSKPESDKNSVSASDFGFDIDWSAAQKSVKSALQEIGVNETDILSLDVENVNDSSTQIDATFMIQTDVMKLEADLVYYKTFDKWAIIWIINNDNQHIYYLEPSLAGTMDLYHYPSDELVSSATSSLDQHAQELETIWESLDEKNAAAWSSIAEEYGIN